MRSILGLGFGLGLVSMFGCAVQVTGEAPMQAAQAESGAGAGALVYFRDTTKNAGANQVFLGDASGANARAIAEGRWPDIDADGKQVTYIEGNAALAARKLVVRHLGEHELIEEWSVPEGTSPTYPDLSADGRTLAFSITTASGTRKVAVLDLERERRKGEVSRDATSDPPRARFVGEPRILDTGDDEGLVPSLSAHGDLVAFVRRPVTRGHDLDATYHAAECGGRILLANLHTGGIHTLVDGRCTWRPAISPDGKMLAYEEAVSGIRGDTHIWAVGLSGHDEPHPLTAGMVEFEPNFAADGTLLYSTIRFAEGHEDTAEIDELGPGARASSADAGRALVAGGGPFLRASRSAR
jgi:hypothetical protein